MGNSFTADVGEHLAVFTPMDRREWEPVAGTKLIGFGIGVALFLVLILRSEPGFVYLLDHANLLFNKAAHPMIGLFSSRLEPYGGTIWSTGLPLCVGSVLLAQEASAGLCPSVHLVLRKLVCHFNRAQRDVVLGAGAVQQLPNTPGRRPALRTWDRGNWVGCLIIQGDGLG